MLVTPEIIKKILKENLEIESDLSDIDLDQHLIELGLDSIYFIQLIVAFESEFDIQFDEEELDMENFSTINNIINYLNVKIKKKEN
ncbi:hypothetical protein N496_03930 [Clostridium botulinum A2B3 87]|uniref:acyl carrier protein n=1 Tax=Clostridium botulinum TaxID=1491 RepID=UPI0004A57C67|nr:acyl carrier protein [Clostridium botulinum]KEI98764.1 hypothetical protein N496_03930 [Clostridium botulinum A2B3 87]MBN3346588.1 hypothetical protein [Clostridium botulinum]